MQSHLKKIISILATVFEWLCIAVILLVVFNFSLISYGIDQLEGQTSIVWKAKPIDEVLADPAFPDSLKKKLYLIGEIKKYAIDSLGLRPGKNYTTLYDQHGKPLLMNLTASEKIGRAHV